MFFLLPVLAVVAETATAVTGTVLASTGAVGAAIAAGTTAIGGIAGGQLLEQQPHLGLKRQLRQQWGLLRQEARRQH